MVKLVERKQKLLKLLMVNRDSPAYQAGRLVGRLVLIGLGYIVGKRWGRKPIDKSFPEKPVKKK